MDRVRILVIINLVGSALSIGGLFLPWGTQEWPPGTMSASAYPLGIELPLGKLALAGCIVAVYFLLIDIRRRSRYSRALTLLGSLAAALCALIWIVYPGALYVSGWPPFKALYGTYVSFAGALVALIGASVLLVED